MVPIAPIATPAANRADDTPAAHITLWYPPPLRLWPVPACSLDAGPRFQCCTIRRGLRILPVMVALADRGGAQWAVSGGVGQREVALEG